MNSQVKVGSKVGQELGYLGGLDGVRVSFVRWGKNDYALVWDGVEVAQFKYFSAANDTFGQVFDAVWN